MLRAAFIPLGFVLTEGETTATVSSALGTAFTSVASDCMNAITTILPIALPVLGALVVVGIGIKIFKKVTGK